MCMKEQVNFHLGLEQLHALRLPQDTGGLLCRCVRCRTDVSRYNKQILSVTGQTDAQVRFESSSPHMCEMSVTRSRS